MNEITPHTQPHSLFLPSRAASIAVSAIEMPVKSLWRASIAVYAVESG